MIRGSSGQKIGAQLVSATDGSAYSGTVTVYVTGDAGIQAIGVTGSGICTAEGNGYFSYAPHVTETAYDLIAFTFIGTGAVPATIQVYTDDSSFATPTWVGQTSQSAYSTSVPLFTSSDVLSELRDWGGASSDDKADRMILRAAEKALRDIAGIRKWTYYQRRGRVVTYTPYSTGTITYTHATRLVTLSGGTFPTWAASGVLVIGDAYYVSEFRPSGTTLALRSDSNPGADVAATAYTLCQDAYTLPVDFMAFTTHMLDISRSFAIRHVDHDEFNTFSMGNLTPSTPCIATTVRDRNTQGLLAVNLRPPPSEARAYEFFYELRPRGFCVPKGAYTTGTVTSSSTTITGVSTLWTSDMVGSVIRFSRNANAPTSFMESNKYVGQAMILSVTSATVLVIDAALGTEVSAVGYEISDPVDVEPGAMYTAFIRQAEYHLALSSHKDDPKAVDAAEQRAQRAIQQACAADSRESISMLSGTYWNVLGTVSSGI